jgi:hypothetical protein
MSEELVNEQVIEESTNEEVIEDGLQEEGQENEEVDQEEEKENKVPLASLLEEKKKRKELEKRLRALEEKELDSSILDEKLKIKQKYIQKGYDEDFADSLAEDFASLKSELKKSTRKDQDTLDEDIEDLASQDVFYSDAMAYKKEIKSKIGEFKKKGHELSVEDAYTLIRGKTRAKELKEDLEQKEILSKRGAPKSKTINASSSAPKNPYPLDDADKKALERLQRRQPESSWTAEKYYKMFKK